jgi:hypothetical protein
VQSLKKKVGNKQKKFTAIRRLGILLIRFSLTTNKASIPPLIIKEIIGI